jgi:tRNA (guanine-N7-)-methyltransferase
VGLSPSPIGRGVGVRVRCCIEARRIRTLIRRCRATFSRWEKEKTHVLIRRELRRLVPVGQEYPSMFANSRVVESSQTAPHPRLREIVARHLNMPYRREPSEAGRAAFATVVEHLQAPFILDAGCGTGASTLVLARMFPQHVVLGVDKSAARLAVGQRMLETDSSHRNVLLLHCELVDFWQLAAAAGLRCARQFLLYPNPWPKPEHVMRRWHAHPVLPCMLALGGAIELRTNWQVYAQEFAQALQAASVAIACAPLQVDQQPLTPFERKYTASGHTLWTCRVT